MLLDHVLGAAASSQHKPRLTGTFTLRYVRTTRLGNLHAEARIVRTEGVKAYAVGHLAPILITSRLTSSPRLKPGDSNLVTPLGCGVGAVIPRGFLLVPASVASPGPRGGVGLGRQ
jgi:hypothetical protein